MKKREQQTISNTSILIIACAMFLLVLSGCSDEQTRIDSPDNLTPPNTDSNVVVNDTTNTQVQPPQDITNTTVTPKPSVAPNNTNIVVTKPQVVVDEKGFAKYTANALECSGIVAPVCGLNEITYTSPCELRNYGDTFVKYGLCDLDKTRKLGIKTSPAYEECGDKVDLVCGVDSNTYLNNCYAEYSEIDINFIGSCLARRLPSEQAKATLQGTSCNLELNLICGKDGITYQNKCIMESKGVEYATNGSCTPPVKHCQDYLPVCGVNNASYASKCMADRYNVKTMPKFRTCENYNI